MIPHYQAGQGDDAQVLYLGLQLLSWLAWTAVTKCRGPGGFHKYLFAHNSGGRERWQGPPLGGQTTAFSLDAYKDTNPMGLGPHSSDLILSLIISLKTPSLNIITSVFGLQHMNFEETQFSQ